MIKSLRDIRKSYNVFLSIIFSSSSKIIQFLFLPNSTILNKIDTYFVFISTDVKIICSNNFMPGVT